MCWYVVRCGNRACSMVGDVMVMPAVVKCESKEEGESDGERINANSAAKSAAKRT